MSRYCQANLCPGNCCDYYAYCSYPSISTVCYSQITYYYDSFWWVYTIAGIVLFIAIITALCVARRRRRRRRMQDTIIINQGVNPSYAIGQPVYNNNQTEMQGQSNAGYYNYENNPYSGYNNQAQNQGGYNQGMTENGNQNILGGGAQQALGYGLADNLTRNQ